MDEPTALLWSVQLGNVWWESIDYINHTASLNDTQLTKSSHGKFRIVIAQDDPGVPNWLDPAGHSHGAVLFRMQEAEQITQPQMQIVKVAELAEHLPQDTLQVAAEQRQEEIRVRRRHAAIRWAP